MFDIGPMTPDPMTEQLVRSVPEEPEPASSETAVGFAAPPLERLPMALRILRDARREYETQFDADQAWVDEQAAELNERKVVRDAKEAVVTGARQAVVEILSDFAFDITGTDPLHAGPKMPQTVGCGTCGARIKYVADRARVTVRCQKCGAVTMLDFAGGTPPETPPA